MASLAAMRWLFLFCLVAAPVGAEPPRLQQPIACTLGQDCHIQQFPDQDPGPGAQDFRCGPLTYDTHSGTDFALPSLAAMSRGVDVLAAADGMVVATRDGMTDALQTGDAAPSVAGRECGNGVVIDHGGGWQTQYCHLADGSLTVARGDSVLAGMPLGQVGLSGETQFPHLHMSVRHNRMDVDPFDPEDVPGCDTDPAKDMWEPDLYAPEGGIIAIGFSGAIPEFDDIKAGTAASDSLSSDSPAFVIWGYIFGGQIGDTVTLEIAGINRQEVVLDRTQAQLFRATGRRTPARGWPQGSYEGAITLQRDGKILDQRKATISVTAP